MREAEVVDAFAGWLGRRGWVVQREVQFVDLLAEHPDGRRMYVEAKGHTSSPGLDLDTQYGQLLRRMDPTDPAARYAVVVPADLQKAAARVPLHIRERLRIDLYLVDEQGEVVAQ